MDKSEYIPEMIESGETALSSYTMIRSPLPKVYALSKKYRNLIVLRDELINPNEQIKIELWNYDPLIFSNNTKCIDILSLIFSLKNNNDERVERAIEDLLIHKWEEII